MTRLLAYIICLYVNFSCIALAQSADTFKTFTHSNAPTEIKVFSEESISLGSKLEYIEDPDNTLSLADVRSLESHAWMKSDSETPNFGYTDSSYWLRFRLNNQITCCGAVQENKIIAVKYALLDHIEYYEIIDGQIFRSTVTGDIYPFSQRPLRHRDFLFPISFEFD